MEKITCYIINASQSEEDLIGTNIDFTIDTVFGKQFSGKAGGGDAFFEVVGTTFINGKAAFETNWCVNNTLRRRMIYIDNGPKYELSRRLINVMETGSVEGNHGAISFYTNPRTNEKEARFGLLQGSYQNYTPLILKKYQNKTGRVVEMCGPRDIDAINTLKNLRTQPEMIEAQNDIVVKNIYVPAEKFCQDKGFVSDLSHAIISFSFVVFGCVPNFLQRKMQENHVDEKPWITDFVICMREWLNNHEKHVFRQRGKQSNLFETFIKDGNWNPKPSSITLNGINLG